MQDDQAEPAGAAPVLRLTLAGVLLILVLTGIGAAIPATGWDGGPWHRHGTPLGAGLELVLIALLVAVEVLRRRRPVTAQPAAGLRAVLRTGLIVGVIAIPVLIIVNAQGNLRPPPPHPLPLKGPRHLPVRRSHVPSGHGVAVGAEIVLYVLLAALALAAIVTCIVLIRRRERRGGWGDIDGQDIGEDQEQLRRAVESGRAALREIDDARLAIIACYVAMERTLARAGAVRADAETPDELLARATAAGLARGAEAARLTELFYEARFSTHPLPPQRRDEARRLLEVLAAGLDAPPAPEATPEGAQ